MDRDHVIQRLIHDQLEKLDTGKYSDRLMRLLESSLADLDDMSDEELERELSRRGIAAEFDAPTDPVDEPDDAEADEEDDDYDVRSLLGTMGRDDWAPLPG
jgi:hypothetical protein